MILSDEKISNIISNVLNDSGFDDLQFAIIKSPSDLKKLHQFRLDQYEKTNQYMINELDEDGVDRYDQHSFLFAAYYQDNIVGTVRLTPVPFETSHYLNEEQLFDYLGRDVSYLEWSRLLIDTSIKVKNLLPALMVYAGLYILNNTSYTHYFGYTKPIIRRLLSKFQIAEEKKRFYISSRGDHPYDLLKGSFLKDFQHLIETGIA